MTQVVPKLIYEDNHLLVIGRPVNIPSQPMNPMIRICFPF